MGMDYEYEAWDEEDSGLVIIHNGGPGDPPCTASRDCPCRPAALRPDDDLAFARLRQAEELGPS